MSQSQLSSFICVQFAFVCVCVCVLYAYYVRVSHFPCVFFPPPVHQGGVWLAVTSVRKFPVRKATWISFRAGPRGGLGCRGRETGRGGTHSGSVSAFRAERLALSGHLWEVEGGGRVIPLPQVRGWTGERSHYEERWALSVPCPPCSVFLSLFLPLISSGNIVQSCICLWMWA